MVSPYYIGNAGQPDPMMQGINDAQTAMMNQIKLQGLRGEMQQQPQAAQAAAQQEQRNKANLDSFFQSGDKSSLYRFLLDNPKMAEAGKTVMSGVSEDQKRDVLSFGARFDSALSNGATDVAKSLLNERIKAAQNSGDVNTVTSLKTYADALDSGDKTRINAIHRQHQLEMALMDGDYAKNLGAYGDEIRKQQTQPSTVQKSQAEAQIKQSEAQYANADNQASLQAKLTDIEVALRNAASAEERNRLEREKSTVELQMKMAKGVDIPPAMLTVQAEAAKQAVAARNAAASSLVLADEFSKIPEGRLFGRGVTGFEEWVRSQAGGEDKLTELRQQYMTLRNKLVGVDAADFKPLSNTDLQMLMGGYPNENSSPQYIANFLRKYAKAQEIAARNEETKTEWINQVGNMGSTRQPIEINGVVVPKGTSYSKYIRSLGGNPTGKPTKSLDDIWK